MTKTPKGFYIEYDSLIDGSPCVAIVNASRNNDKTDQGIQVWYIRRDLNPFDATVQGADVSVCGHCPRRHHLGGDCYVVTFHAPVSIYKAFLLKSYASHCPGKAASKEIIKFLDRAPRGPKTILRLGAYGDPLSAPWSVTQEIFRITRSHYPEHTGYTHLWKLAETLGAPEAKHFLQASCDSIPEEEEAFAAGWNPYTAIPESKEGGRKKKEKDIVHCPSQAAKKKETASPITCGGCKVKCNGAKRGGPRRKTRVFLHGMRSARKNKAEQSKFDA